MLGRFAPALVSIPWLLAGCAMEVAEGPPVEGRSAALRDLDSTEAEFLRILNEHRMENGAPPVRAERALNQGARDYSIVMGESNNFDHTGPDGSNFSERMCDAGYEPACGPSTAVGENIAAGQRTAREAFQSWRGSPGHNRNMLDPDFKVVGIGRAEVPGSEWGLYWTNTFAGQETEEAVPLEGGGEDAGAGGSGGGRKGSGCSAAGDGAPAHTGALAAVLVGLALARRRRP